MLDQQYIHTLFDNVTNQTNETRRSAEEVSNKTPVSKLINRFKSPQTLKADAEYDVEQGCNEKTHSGSNTRSGSINTHNSTINTHSGCSNTPSGSGKHRNRSGSFPTLFA